jgi:hypothetical protein
MSYTTDAPTTTTTTTTSAAANLLASAPIYFLSLIALVGLIVLTALHDVTATTSIPLIAVIAGVHTGAAANAASNNT